MIESLKKIFSVRNMNRALAQFGSVSLESFFVYALLGILIIILIALVRKLQGKTTLIIDMLAGGVLAVYGSIMLQLTLVCRESGSRIGIELDLFHGLLGPENDFHWLMLAYVILNCLMFIPYGFALSLFVAVHERKTGIQCILVTLLSFVTSMFIECAQLITQRGYYEVQDLTVNTLGGFIGWVIFYCLYKIGSIFMMKRAED